MHQREELLPMRSALPARPLARDVSTSAQYQIRTAERPDNPSIDASNEFAGPYQNQEADESTTPASTITTSFDTIRQVTPAVESAASAQSSSAQNLGGQVCR